MNMQDYQLMLKKVNELTEARDFTKLSDIFKPLWNSREHESQEYFYGIDHVKEEHDVYEENKSLSSFDTFRSRLEQFIKDEISLCLRRQASLVSGFQELQASIFREAQTAKATEDTASKYFHELSELIQQVDLGCYNDKGLVKQRIIGLNEMLKAAKLHNIFPVNLTADLVKDLLVEQLIREN